MTVVLELQPALRSELKDPFGPVSTDTAAVVARAGESLVTVGDIVTYHTLGAGHVPDVAFVDERTERAAVDEAVWAGIDPEAFDRVVTVDNPAGTLTVALLEELADALASDERTLVQVEGEEDLAALAVIATVPEGASVLYGQPGEGVVHVTVDADIRDRVRSLMVQMDGDTDRAFAALGIDAD